MPPKKKVSWLKAKPGNVPFKSSRINPRWVQHAFEDDIFIGHHNVIPEAVNDNVGIPVTGYTQYNENTDRSVTRTRRRKQRHPKRARD